MYDAIIVGCGPAGLTAGIYLARAGKKVLMFEKESIGGQMATAPLIENYPGVDDMSGTDLAYKMYDQAKKYGAKLKAERVTKVYKTKVIADDKEYKAKVIILATGANNRRLGLENESNLIGKGIHFCTACDGTFYKDKVVAVIGGANSAVTNAIYLANICRKVYLINRDSKLSCENILEHKILEKSNIEILYNSEVVKINGKDKLKNVIIKTKNNERKLQIDGMFEAIGVVAQSDIAAKLLERDEKDYFIGNNTETKYENIFVIGDCVSKKVKQITTAVNDGTIAATLAINYLNRRN